MDVRDVLQDETRRRRCRVTLIGIVGGWLTLLASTVFGAGASEGIGLFGFLLFAISWVVGRIIVRDVAERPAIQVDEYEFVERARVRDVGYVVALAALVLSFVLLTVANKMAERGDLGLLQRCPHIVFLGFLTAAALPTALLVWRTRDIPDNPEI